MGGSALRATVRVPRLPRPDVVTAIPYAYIAALSLAIYLLEPSLLTGPGAFDVLATAVVPLALVAFGQTIAIITRGIDLSVGGVVSTTTAILATHGGTSGPTVVGQVVLVVAIGVLAGVINGLLVAFTPLQPFIVTLATWSIWGGIAFLVLPIEGGAPAPELITWLTGAWLGVPRSVVVVAGLLVAWLWLRSTRFLIDVRAIGSDEARARLVGVPIRMRKIQVYALSGALAAVAGVYLAAQTGSGAPNAGDQFILNSVAAVVIGGASIFGGTGSAAGSIVGAAVLILIPDVVFALRLTSFWSVFLQGFVLVVTVTISSVVITLRMRRRRGAG
ncbi:MAG: ABC transporter permease [Actinobacteria bacterium]|nr:ABC transporter permease [Actinomycetota bacterium]